MLIEIVGVITFIVFVIMMVVYWLDLRSGNGKLPSSFVQAKKNHTIANELLNAFKKYPDKQRFLLFWLQLQRIHQNKLEGDIAELGVYQGDTAFLLKLMAPDKTLHLFDTFEGFQKNDLKDEKGEAAAYTPQHFADTSLEKVKARLNGFDSIVCYAGQFSEQCHKATNVKFCFVSLDVDLAQPTAQGLNFFYERLVPGGVIIVHDYNHKWPGLVEAVDKFTDQIPENPVIIPDKDSSLVIIKNSKLALNFQQE
jgi:O-methyltransferase